MSEKVKPCGAYVRLNNWPSSCGRPGTGEGGLCKEHAAGKKRSEASREKSDAKCAADRAEDARRKVAFYRFVATLDKQALRGDLLASYAEVRKHLRMQMTSRDYMIMPPQEKETK